jgi:signal transduction histidine kinase
MSESKIADLVHGDVAKLEELIDRESTADVCRSFFDLFGLSVRVYSSSGALLADIHQEREICRLVNQYPPGNIACVNTVGQVRQTKPGGQGVFCSCFTAAIYYVIPIIYDERQLGRIALGPYLPAEIENVPETLMQILPDSEEQCASEALAEMPRVREETARRLAAHLQRVLELMLFAGHRTQLTSDMHLASVREGYRELSEKNAALQSAYGKLQQLDRLKSDFLGTVSHELRTPLTSIIGYSEMLLAGIGGELQGEHPAFAEIIRSKGELLLSLITNLLDLSKIERDQINLELSNVDPMAILEEIVDMLRPEADKKGVRMEIIEKMHLPALTADEVRLKQVLLNIAGNAMKFTPSGGLVRLAAREGEIDAKSPENEQVGASVMLGRARTIEFAVQDTGIGISEGEIEHIFDAFYQVDGGSTREYGGAGLGLAIAKKLVVAHGGEIRVQSALGEGTTVFVSLPQQPLRAQP